VSELTVCTIVSANYLAFARVLVDHRFDPGDESFEVLPVEQLPTLVDPLPFLFKYTVLEANTAVKPYLLEHLLREGAQRVVYLDPDIQLFGPLTMVEEALERCRIVLTPHLTAPIDDDRFPDELAIMQSGTYNLGFLGLAAGDTTDAFLGWWRDRIFDRCISRVEQGLFVDQKWIDLVPGLFDGVHVLKDPGYNVAYWNLHSRRVELGEEFRVNGRPLAFFHFSGIDPLMLENLSRHQDRFRLSDIGDAAELYRGYARLLADQGHAETGSMSYSYGTFDDGTPIPDVARDLYRSLGDGRGRFGDPFAVAGGFKGWLNRPYGVHPTRLTRLAHHIWSAQEHLRIAFPDPTGEHTQGLIDWLEEYGAAEYRLTEDFLAPMRIGDDGTPEPSLGRRVRRELGKLWISEPVKRARGVIKRLVGPERVHILKKWLAAPTAGQSRGPGHLSRPDHGLPAGVNIIGYLRAESGIGESARAMVRTLRSAGVTISVTDLDVGVRSRRSDRSVDLSGDDVDHAVNLLMVNADQVEDTAAHLGPERFAGHRNVGMWAWEMERFPDEWLHAFDRFDEIWTYSRFSVDGLASVSPVPVRRMPLAVEAPADLEHRRSEFELPDDMFLVLTVFDFLSYFERKNPLALVEAFRRAFGDRGDALLVVKTANSDFAPDRFAELKRAMTGLNALMIDRVLDRDAVWRLMACCDVYGSLHRAEGYGLTMAEAMALGKPVVATAYSGNIDFMNPSNSLLVGYRLVPVERQQGPYRRGWLWADPDLDQAAEWLVRLHGDHDLRTRIGDAARDHVENLLSPSAIADIARDRIVSLLQRRPRRQR